MLVVPGNRRLLRRRIKSAVARRIETGAMVYTDGKEQFFLAMVEPPKRVRTAQIPAREYIFVLDVSGSMAALDFKPTDRLGLANDVISRFITGRTDDRIGIVTHGGFANRVLHVLFDNDGTEDGAYFSHYNTAISRIDFTTDGTVRVRYLNRVEHLPPTLVT